MIYQYIPIKSKCYEFKLSERALASQAKLSRACLRKVFIGAASCTINSVAKLINCLGLELTLIAHPADIQSEHSVIAVAYKILNEGFESWKVHLFNFVDEFRRSLDPRLLLLPPPQQLEPKLYALLAAVTYQLCLESGMQIPVWAKQSNYLNQPWFPSESQALKAYAILESPYAFRRNNIFVLENFLARV